MSQSTSARQKLEERAHWLSHADLIAQLELQPGMTVAEIGAGSGYYCVPIAQHVAPEGKVFAVESLNATPPANAPSNLEPVAGYPWRTNLPDDCCDVVLVADLLNGLTDRQGTLCEAKRILREGGRLAIIEWRPSAPSSGGPESERRITPQDMICMCELNSWSLVRRGEDWPNGYLFLFEPTDESVQS